MVAKRITPSSQQYQRWVTSTRPYKIGVQYPTVLVWNACTHPHNPDHQAMTGWVTRCGAEVCQWCNPTLINERGRLILSWLDGNPQKQVAAIRLLEQAGERIEEYWEP